MQKILACLIVALSPLTSFGWSDSGHHLVALLAYDHLTPAEQNQLLDILAAHPRYREDFTPPLTIRSADRFRIGTAGYWPDIARDFPEHNRPTWHYQLGAALTMGDPTGYTVHATPGPCPPSANMQTQELHAAQAVELCRRVMADGNSSPSDRAIALCWLAHLVGDTHQPCHAGSLYAANLFPEGDRGGNSIPTVQKENMHAFWDTLLGFGIDEAMMNRRVEYIATRTDYRVLGKKVLQRAATLDPLTWLAESRDYSKQFAYTPEVLGPVKAAMGSPGMEMQPINFSIAYQKTARHVALRRVAEAGYRLAEVWRMCFRRN